MGRIKCDDNRVESNDCSRKLLYRESTGGLTKRETNGWYGVDDYDFDHEVVGSMSSSAPCSVAGTTGMGNKPIRVNILPKNIAKRDGAIDDIEEGQAKRRKIVWRDDNEDNKDEWQEGPNYREEERCAWFVAGEFARQVSSGEDTKIPVFGSHSMGG